MVSRALSIVSSGPPARSGQWEPSLLTTCVGPWFSDAESGSIVSSSESMLIVGALMPMIVAHAPRPGWPRA
eukprot:4604201-Heterocapsa_arctica.AAC.1